MGSLLLAIVWIMTYTLAPVPGQRSLHGWNYVITVALLGCFVGSASRWRGDPPDARSSADEGTPMGPHRP